MKKAIDIQIGETVYNCPLGLGLLGECLENLGLDITELNDKLTENSFKWTPILISESIKYSGVENDLTAKDIMDYIEEEGKAFEVIAKFNNAFNDSLLKNVPKQEPVKNSNVQKKKVVRKK